MRRSIASIERLLKVGRWLLVAGEDLAMVDHAHAARAARCWRCVEEGRHAGRRRRCGCSAARARSAAARRRSRLDLAAVAEAGGVGGGMALRGVGAEQAARACARAPGSLPSTQVITASIGFMRASTRQMKKAAIRVAALRSPRGRGAKPGQAANSARIFFSALASIWRMRSADTPYSSASSCSVAFGSPRKRRLRMSRERASRSDRPSRSSSSWLSSWSSRS